MPEPIPTNSEPSKNEAPAAAKPTAKKTDMLSKEEKLLSALGYFGVLCVLPLCLKKDSAFCQHHGKQGLVLAIFFFFLFSILGAFMGAFIGLLQIVISIAMAFTASKGNKTSLPVVSDISSKLSF